MKERLLFILAPIDYYVTPKSDLNKYGCNVQYQLKGKPCRVIIGGYETANDHSIPKPFQSRSYVTNSVLAVQVERFKGSSRHRSEQVARGYVCICSDMGL